jgi:hypothetical protein
MIHLALGLVALFLVFRVYRVLVATVMAMGRLGGEAIAREQSKRPFAIRKEVN